jgi:hypothetical protein
MSSTVSKTIHYFTRFAGSDISFVSGPELVLSPSLAILYCFRHLRRPLKLFAIKLLLVAVVLNCSQHTVTVFLKKVDVKNLVTKQLKRTLIRHGYCITI